MNKKIRKGKWLERIKRCAAFVLAALLILNSFNFPAYASETEQSTEVESTIDVQPQNTTTTTEVTFEVTGDHLVGDKDETVEIKVFDQADTSKATNLIDTNVDIKRPGGNAYTVTLSAALDTAKTYLYTISSNRYTKAVEGEFAGTISEKIIVNKFDNVTDGNPPIQVKTSGKITDKAGTAGITGATLSAVYIDENNQEIASPVITTPTYDITTMKYSFESNINRKVQLKIIADGYDKTELIEVEDAGTTDKNFQLDKIKKNITVTCGVNGSVKYTDEGSVLQEVTNGSGTVAVTYGENKEFEIVPLARYEVGSFKIGGQDAALPTEVNGKIIYKFDTVKQDTSLDVEFAPIIKLENVTCSEVDWTKGEVTITGKVTGLPANKKAKVTCTSMNTNAGEAFEEQETGSDGTFTFVCKAESNAVSYIIKAVDPEVGTIEITQDNVGPVYIDKTSPTINSVTATGSGFVYKNTTETWVKNGASIQVTATDAESGLVPEQGVNNLVIQDGAGTVLDERIYIGDAYTPKLETENTNSKVIVRDKLGNEISSDNTFRIDNNAPTVKPITTEDYYSPLENITINNPFEDAESGLDHSKYTIAFYGNDNKLQAAEPISLSSEGKFVIDQTKLTEENKYKCVLTAYDNLGNSKSTDDLILKVDRIEPEVTFTYERKETPKEKILRILSFGVFANHDVRIKVSAKDEGLGFTKGKSQIKLFYDGQPLTAEEGTENDLDSTNQSNKNCLNQNFILEFSSHKEKLKKIDAIVQDDAANEKKVQVSNGNTAIDFMLEATAPTIESNMEYQITGDTSKPGSAIEDGGLKWCDGKTTAIVSFTVKDPGGKDQASGIHHVKATVNGRYILENKALEPYLKQKDNPPKYGSDTNATESAVDSYTYEFELNIDNAKQTNDFLKLDDKNRWKIEFEVVDNAGNVSTSGDEQKIQSIGFDEDAPEVDSITYSSSEGDTVLKLQERKFGTYSNKSMLIKVQASDVKSGIKAGEESIKAYYGEGDSALPLALYTDKNINNSQPGTATFILPVDGESIDKNKIDQKIQIVATDKVGNATERISAKDSSNKDAKFLLESNAPTLKETITRIETVNGKKQAVQPYQGEGETWVNGRTVVTYQYEVQDIQSGLYKVEASINGKAITFGSSTDAKYSVKEKLPEYGASADSTQKDNAKYVFTIPIAIEDNGKESKRTIAFKVTDNAGNVISNLEKTATFWFDKTAPEVTTTYEPARTFLDAVLRILSFGTYTNDNIKITTTATDAQSGFRTGLPADKRDIQLTYDGKPLEFVNEKVEPISVNGKERKNGKITATYMLNCKNPNLVKFEKVKVQAKDNVNNLTDTVVKTNKKEIQFMLEKQKPVITEGSHDYSTDQIYAEEANKKKIWCSGSTAATYEFILEDKNSGLNDVQIDINGTKQTLRPAVVTYEGKPPVESGSLPYLTENVVSSSNQKIVKAVYRIPIALKDADLRTGEARIGIQVIDNAGNQSVYSSKGNSELWFDDRVPNIPVTTFTFESTGMQTQDENPVHVYTQSDGTVNFGYFFENETTVSFRVDDFARNGVDELGSAIQEVNYRLKPFDGTDILGTVSFDQNAKTCQFRIPQNFRGEVFVHAIDHVRNNSGEKRPNGIVLEDALTHAKEAGSAITIPATGYKDALGNPLYPTPQTIGLNIYDHHSGIRNSVYTYKSYYKGEDVKNTTIANSWEEESGQYNTPDIHNEIGLNLVQEINSNLYVNANGSKEIAEDANNISLDLMMTDRMGYITQAEQKIVSIDTIAPVVDVTWDNHDVRNEKYYKADRTATITVKERNFNPDASNHVITGPTPSISGWTHIPGSTCNGSVHTDECVYTSSVTFSQDGDYTYTFTTTDLAGHSSVYSTVDDFVLDKTTPVIRVSYDNNDVRNGMYYKAARIGTISIDEHNFRGSDVQPTITASNGGAGAAAPGVNGWSSAGDINTATVGYTYDGDFTFDIAYEDMAGNVAADYTQDRFIVDLTVPKLELYDIVDKSANNDVVAPGVRYSDTNVDGNGVVIELTGANHGAYKMDGNKAVSSTGVDMKLFDFPRQKEVDDLYTMKAIVNDLAGNQSEQSVMFSVNRFGSVYVLSDPTQKLVEDRFTNEEQEVIVTEVNVDTLQKKEISSARDGELKELKEDADYRVASSGDEASWKRYLYTIDKENFAEEGNYTVTLYSEDRAANTQNNKVKEKDIEFVIDKTTPSAVISGVENDGQYRSNKRTVKLDVQDNILLDQATVILNGKKKVYREAEIEKNDGVITMNIESSNTWQNIKVVSVDAAGNQAETEDVRFLITTNLLVQFVSNKPVLYTSAGSVAVAGVGAAMFFGRRRRLLHK